ncbi:xanthine dehydrogenase family protein molybdopterin-binding subunit [Desulforhopalus singaporensis]|uniref:CO or xanthine dehydrogenase, Mo-binding subunit n=1 Tax=Desulforhopalus singaporensis TaxID=91360 RepID=A0A1H0N7K7_9BACT|nr:xanthine dehydrogenase family protein molybdopterin-binding subunit [Desulforhopalus singaporensis]SDO88310.1 CO or xanthine dehydrogenase, Mo-binding subunit [Desulforhopalus singaporensis]
MEQQFRVVGNSVPRSCSKAKVTGEIKFAADIKLDNSLVLKTKRSDQPHALIRSINVEKALAVEGVRSVFTARDIPGKNLLGIINKDQPLLAEDRVRSLADAVALVVADTEEAAERGAAAVEVEYQELEAVFDPVEALKEGAVQVHEKGNLLSCRKVVKGDVEAAFTSAYSVIEKEYTTSSIEHNYIEPDAGAGYVDENGCLVIYASTQNPHYDHKEVVGLLGVADDEVRIIQATTGGGFGSKLDLNVQGFIGLALYHLKCPVRYVYSREEAYLATAKRHPFVIRVKTATDKDGRFIALQMRAVCNTGAYGSYGMAVASRSAVHATGPYAIENVDVDVKCVYTNQTFCGAMRGFGAPQMALAHESQMDLHAQALGLDPLAIRRINGLRAGQTSATGQLLTASVGFQDCLDAVAPYYEDAKENWLSAPTDPFKRRGIGIGGMWYGIGNTGVQNPSTARVEMSPEGKVTVFTGCADIGQGSTTILAQITAEVLGLGHDDITMVVGDTGCTTNAGATSASRQTYISGNAVKDGAEKLANVLLTEAVDRLRAPKNSLHFVDGHVAVSIAPEIRVSVAKLAKRIHDKGGTLSWQGFFDPETVPLDPETGEGVPYATYAYACHMAQVEVDVLTGEVDVKRIVAAHDVGHALHPGNVVGQICGGVAMGVGFALMEEFEPGKTESMKDYHVPTVSDVPEVVPIIIESPEPSGPFGAKGVGEPALIPTAPAIINGISSALNKRIYDLPANLERVIEASIQAGHFRVQE